MIMTKMAIMTRQIVMMPTLQSLYLNGTITMQTMMVLELNQALNMCVQPQEVKAILKPNIETTPFKLIVMIPTPMFIQMQ